LGLTAVIPTAIMSMEIGSPTVPKYLDKGEHKLYISPEAMEDIRNWNVTKIDEKTKREIFRNGWGNKIHG